MKRLLSLMAIIAFGFSSVFASYQANTTLEKHVSTAGDSLISIIDTQYNANYQVLIDLLMTYQPRFAGDEKRTWIVNTLIMHVKNHMAMAADTMNIDMNKNSMDTMHMDEDMTMNHVVIDITGENFAFSMDEITVNKGDKVTINFESTDGFHDWVVDEFDAATEQVRPGTMTSVTFMADEAGMYEYYCSVGSHRAQGMVGTLIVEDTEMMDEKHMMKMDMLKNANTLEHVAIGQTIRGISFDGSETARAATMTTDGMTHVHAEFMNLPDLDENNFYEGWAVRKSPFDFISTGELMMKDGVYINDWMSDGDYSEYTHYVLTLEPRDNDPAPAEHIFEGDM